MGERTKPAYMTSHLPPPEDPEFTSEPKVLSPVSPKPLHYPVPENIPILERQIDQAFNQTSLHMAQAAILQQHQHPHQQPFAEHQEQQHQQQQQQQPEASLVSATSSLPTPIEHADLQQSRAPAQAVASDEQVPEQVHDAQPLNHQLMNHAPPPAEYNVTSASAPSDETASPAQASTKSIPPPAQSPIPNHDHHHPTTTTTTITTTATAIYSSSISAPSSSPNATVTAQKLEPALNSHPDAQFQGVSVEAPPPPSVDTNVSKANFEQDIENLLATLSQGNPFPADQSQADSSTAVPLVSSIANVLEPAPGTDSSPNIAALNGPPPGLPPKPPAQEQLSMNPNYAPTTDIRAYHPHSQHALQPQAQQAATTSTSTTTTNHHANSQNPSSFPTASGQGANGLPPPPVATFQQSQGPASVQPLSQSPTSQANRQRELESQREIKLAAGEVLDDADAPWTPDTQRRYDDFLNKERGYVTEGNWEQFPQGSRLFVGNLSSERVTKRDIFHVFHRYGDLAQISIKQAYGFVQYLQTDACSRAIEIEQGKTIRGKKIHLEVSKPQKNRNTDQRGGRRSRSPVDHSRINSGQQDRRGDNNARGSRRNVGGAGGRRNDDQYRPLLRTPSPRGGYRNNHSHREHYDDRYRSRSRSPTHRNHRYRSPSPIRNNADEEDNLPLPRRRPQDIPDVQLLVLDDLDRNFISYVEHAFSSRSLRVDSLLLSPRLSLDAVVKRQVLEGVLAVCKITRQALSTGKIPLLVFNRRSVGNVGFEEYADLDTNIAAELVLRAKSTAAVSTTPTYMSAPPAQQTNYGYAAAFPPQPPAQLQHFAMPTHQQGQQQQPQSPAGLTNLLSSMDPSNLQRLLGAMQPPVSPSVPQATTGMTPDLAKMLTAGGGGGLPMPSPNGTPQGFGQGYLQQQHGQQQPVGNAHPADPLAALRNNPALAGLLGGQQQQQASPGAAMNHFSPQQRQQPPQYGQLNQPPQNNMGSFAGTMPASQAQKPSGQGAQPDMAEILARLGQYRG